MRKASFSQNPQQLPTVEDGDENSNSSGHSPQFGGGSQQQPRMKRSPYLSVMAGSTKESEDLVAMLSRPAPGGLKRTSGGGTRGMGEAGQPAANSPHAPMGGGKSTFFNLKRPSSIAPASPGGVGFADAHMLQQQQGGSHTVTPVSSAGGEITDGSQQDDGSGGLSANAPGPLDDNLDGSGRPRSGSNAGGPRPILQSSLRSALRMSSRSDVNAMAVSAASEMKKNTSVTFSNTTKKASQLGMIETGMGGVEGEQQGNERFYFNPQQMGGNTEQQQAAQEAEAAARQEANLRQFQQMTSQHFSPSAQQGSSNYSAAMMMKKSQSIAAPQFLLAHKNSAGGSSTTSQASNTANESFAEQGETSQQDGGAEAANTSFPIYFSKIPGEGGEQQGQGTGQPGQMQQHAVQGAVPPPAATTNVGGMGIATSTGEGSPPNHRRLRSKSMNTLKYYYENNSVQSNMDPAQRLLHAAGMSGIDVPPISRPSINGLNLTFRDMLDEGDGAEGDLNLRLRNQQWKDFRTFSNNFENENPMMAAAMDREGMFDKPSPIKETGSVTSTSTTATGTSGTASNVPLSGSKRTLTPSSLNSRNSANTSGSANKVTNNTIFINPGGGMGMGPPYSRTLHGSHRASVSVNDLAVLRRAAARMKMNNPADSFNSQDGSPQQQTIRRQSHRMGETLGGDMLSRLPSDISQSGSSSSISGAQTQHASNTASTANINNNSALSPLAQMMARNNAAKMNAANLNRMSSGSSSGNNNNSGNKNCGSFANQEQQELFFQKFNMALSGSGRMGSGVGNNPAMSPSPFGMGVSSSASGCGLNASGMGRRSRTVGAGLAYGRANMTIDMKSGYRLSRFNLGDLKKENSRLSEISSAGSSAGGRNEEWDLS